MKRAAMRKSRDRRIFRRTAIRSREVNLNPTVMRGGIRL